MTTYLINDDNHDNMITYFAPQISESLVINSPFFSSFPVMRRKSLIALIITILIVLVAACVTLAILLPRMKEDGTASVKPVKRDNEAYQYAKAAVATDSPICSEVIECFVHEMAWVSLGPDRAVV